MEKITLNKQTLTKITFQTICYTQTILLHKYGTKRRAFIVYKILKI